MQEQLEGLMTAKEVAALAEVTVARIHQLCRDETIKATKIADVWLINRKSALEWIYSDRKVGRPPKRKRRDETV